MSKATEVTKTETVITYEVIPQLPGIHPHLRTYVEQEIFPRYSKFFSHGIHHIYRVITDALMLAEYYHKDFNITYAAAACHDLGLKVNRAEHERASGEIIAADKNLLQFFRHLSCKLFAKPPKIIAARVKLRPVVFMVA